MILPGQAAWKLRSGGACRISGKRRDNILAEDAEAERTSWYGLLVLTAGRNARIAANAWEWDAYASVPRSFMGGSNHL
ncbi:hypothetical protein [Paenibacillus larvae]|uniref:hypothetical protein n=1 Tax=Paenibacillus larvae TaxID=1464 RepID=UPI001D042CBB|nr:hypothetical protein [Paenibacillus larvae]MDR5567629.1 hypothetical protein [Paenibacillus larvae]MDR5594366.1 hypothetical protein [Paenibacillus larvae]MDT2267233.1 hypothetical protein [Paenibacillus larvae]